MEGYQTQWYAVRCCCTPKKVFGFLRIPDDLAEKKHFSLPDERGHAQQIEIKTIYSSIGEFTSAGYKRSQYEELAIYSDDRPLEFWRTIPGFVEAA